MKKINKFLAPVLGLALLAGGLAVGARSEKVEKASADETIVKYYPIDKDHFRGAVDFGNDKFGEDSFTGYTRGRMDRFWAGGSGWDSQNRTFNAMDTFIDTIHKAGGENKIGEFRSATWINKGDDNSYVSFLVGGGAEEEGKGKVFVNLFNVTKGIDVFADIRPAFDGRGSYSDESADHLNAPISCNMVLKYMRIPDQYKGDEFLIFIRDEKTSSYGGITFSCLQFNQTLEDVAKTFSAHKAQMKLNEFTSEWNRVANEFVLNYYATDSYYADVRTAESALKDADNDFEANKVAGMAFDYKYMEDHYSEGFLNFDTIVSDVDYKNWVEKMPMNKTGNYFLNADTSGTSEYSFYRFYSNEFTLTGTGLISAKLGGRTARLSLVNADTFAELIGVDNPGFVDATIANVVESGSRCNTMTRTYLDCSAYKNQRVRVAIADWGESAWGLGYFDEIVTRYDSYPSFKVDKITQDYNGLKHGFVLDKYSGPNTTDFGKAYDFVSRYYSIARGQAASFSWCNVSTSTGDLADLIAEYDELDSSVKAIVDGSMDYSYGTKAPGVSYWELNVDTSKTIADSIAYMKTRPQNATNAYFFINGSKQSISAIVLISLITISVVGAGTFFILKKKKHNK